MKNQKECIEILNKAFDEEEIDACAEKPEMIVVEINSEDNSSYMRHQIASVICDTFERNFVMEKLDVIMNQTRLDKEIIDILYGVKITYKV